MPYEALSLMSLVGYLASALVIGSSMMKDLRMLRIVNSLGCMAFVVYGFMLNFAWPIIFTNGFILFVHIYYLTRRPTI